ncbi:MAG TPA: hypothetical protein VKQ30_11675 [Ktedonobacterales bacterium]|nr:hypothetical protein [Ktedonobacterales bacterium]
MQTWSSRPSTTDAKQQSIPAAHNCNLALASAERIRLWLVADWRSAKLVPFGAALAILTVLVTAAYYANRPHIELDPDTGAYLMDAHHIANGGGIVDPARLPGYPLLMAFVFSLAGENRLAAVSVVQAVLFILAAVEIYAVHCLLLRRGILAFLVAALVGTNLQLICHIKPILSEALALFLLTTLALAVVLCVRSLCARAVWGVATCLLALFMTRPEWLYLPVPLFAYLLLLAWREGILRRLLPHALAATLVLYGIAGLYIHANAIQYSCPTLTYVQNINLLGKIMQYHMQDEAIAQYSGFTHIVDRYLAQGDTDPWHVIQSQYSPLFPACYALFYDNSISIIARHPIEYLTKSIPIAGEVLTGTTSQSPILQNEPFADWLLPLDALSRVVMHSLLVFPLVALVWWVMLAWRHTHDQLVVPAMGALALVAFYGLALTSLGGYIFYPRLRTPYGPLLIVVVWSSLVLSGQVAARLLRARGEEGT